MEIDATQHPDVAPVIVESQMSQEIGMTDATEMPEHHPSAGTAAPIRGWKGSFSSAASQTEILIPLSGAPKIAEIGEDTQAYCDEPMNGEPLCQQRVGNVLDALLDDDCEATQAYREFPDEKEAEKGSQQEDLGTAVAESSSGFQCGQPSTECVAAAHADGSSEATRPHDAQIALGQNNGVNNPEESFLDGSAPDDASQDTQVDLDEPERMNDFESVEESRPAGDEHDTSDDVQKTQVYNEFPDEKDAEEESQQEDLGTAVPESSGGFQCGDPSAECVAESQDVELPRVVLDMFSGQSTESGDFAYIEEPLPDVADLAVSMVHVIDLRRGQPLRYQAESQPFPGCTSSEAAPATGSPQPADVICASQARDEAMAPRVQSPRLSLLLPKRARRRVETPGSYEAASEALWGGRTPGRAKRFPSLRELLAAREEESDEPLLKSGVAHVSPFKKSYLEDSPGQRMKEELWSRRRQSIRRWSRSALSARRRSSLRRSRSPVTPWQGKSEMRSAYREASPAPSAPCSPPVARMLNFETPSWLQQVQDLRPFSPGRWPAAAAASPEGKQSNGMACMPDIPTPCRTKRSLGGNDGIASDTDGAALPASPASPASPGASVAPTESEAPTTATTKPASPLVAAMTEAAAAPHAALPESQRSDSVDPLAAPVDTDSQGGQGRDQGMKVSQASQDACRMQRNLSGNDGIASDADGAASPASPASPGASVATTEPASPPEVAAMTEAAAAPHAALPESQRSDSVDPLAAPVDTDSQGGQGRGQGMKVSQASQVESVQPEVSHAESPGQNLSADASVASFQEGSNQTGAELPQFFAQMTQEDVPLRVPIEEVCSRPVEPAEPAEPEFHGSEPKAPVKAKRTAAKSRPRIPSSTTSWQRPLPAELGGPAALDPVATPETLAPEVRTKNRPRGKRPATSVDAAATTVCSAPTEQNTTEVPEPPRQRSTRPLCDDDSEATSKKRKRPATAATATAAKSKATKVDKATRVKTLPPPQSVAKECKLAGDAYISTPAEAAVAAAVGRKVFATTGVELSGRQKRFLMDLQGVLVSDWIPQISHVIADTFRRTTKMMCAICTGARIVTPDYVKACREAGRWVDEEDFTLKDEICESAFARKRGMPGYSLAAAVKRAQSNGPLLQGISVYVFPSVGDKRDLPILVAAAGGMWLKRFPLQPEDPSVLLLAERSVNSERERKRRKTFEVYDVELLREWHFFACGLYPRAAEVCLSTSVIADVQ